MKKTKLRLLVITIGILVLIMLSNKSKAATLDSNTLIKSAGVTITKDMTADQVTKAYGAQPKLVTPSAFGGKMYTYYKTDYKDLLYIETDSNNKIVSYGAMSDDFVTSKYSAGDKKPSSQTVSYLDGDTVIDGAFTSNIIGVLMYNKDNITQSKVNAYFAEFMNDKYSYEKYISQHAVLMVNHYLKVYSNAPMAEYNEEIYDMIKRIQNDGKSIKEYAEENQKSSYFKQAGTDIGYLCNYSELPSPMRPASIAMKYYPTTDKKYAYLNYGLYYNEEQKKYTGSVSAFYVAKDLFEDNNKPVALTADENAKLNLVESTYENSVSVFNQNGTDYYVTKPVYNKVPLVAGEIKENKLKGAVDYLNAIRVGAGLSKVTYDKTLSNYAQHKATLTSYINNKGISNPNPHFPKKPDEVSQEFYEIAQKNMTSENLYYGDMISSITHALNDGNGSPITAGHRYNLLNPNHVNFGLGTTGSQSCHRFSGYSSSGVSMVAWPSAGITPIEAFSGGYWTCKFYSKYSTTSSTNVYVKRLNDNKEWKFETQTQSGINRFVINSDMVSFYNSDLNEEDGRVYEITVKNVKNYNTGKTEDVKYRSVFKSVNEAKQKIYPTSISLDKKEIVGAINSKVILKPTFSSDATEIRTIWSSSNTNVARVNQLGEVTIVGNGTATITVKTLNGKTATCLVRATSDTGNFKIEQSKYIVEVGKTENIKLINTSGIQFNVKDVKWSVSDTKLATIDSNGALTALGDKLSTDGEITVTADYKGKKATCKVLVIPSVTIKPTFKIKNGLSSFRDYLEPGKSTTVSVIQADTYYPIYLDKFEFDFIYDASKFEVVSASSTLKYAKVTFGSGKVHISYDCGTDITKIINTVLNINLRAKSTARYSESKLELENIKYRGYGNKSDTNGVSQYISTLKIADPIEKVELNMSSYTFGNTGYSQYLRATLTPSEHISSTKVTWSSSNDKIVSVSDSGKITSTGYGTAVITATAVNGKKATCTVTVKKPQPTVIPITGISVYPTSATVNKGSTKIVGETITPNYTTQSKKVTWTSSNNSVATVDSTGLVRAVGEGTAVITATTVNGKKATCTITVPKQQTTPTQPSKPSQPTTPTQPTKPTVVEIIGINLNPTNVTLNKGISKTIGATILPSNTTQSKTVTWTTSNANVATVNASGLVTAKGEGTAVITATTSNGKKATCTVTVPKQQTPTQPIQPTTPTKTEKKVPDVGYRTHVQNDGWQGYVRNGAMSGTSGRSLRLEGININLDNNEYGGGIEYRTHVQNIGWQSYVKNGAMSGTSGRSLRLEAIQIRLTGEISKYYDVYYRVHCQNFGWLDWAKNGEEAGSSGYAYRLEGIEIRLVKKGGAAPGKTTKPYIRKYLTYQTHVQNIGWQGAVRDNETSGTSGQSLRLEGIKINLDDQKYSGDIEYRTHVQNIGWQGFVKNGAMSGTSGKSLRLEAIQIRLTGEMAKKYDVYYRVHCQNFGWLGWAKNGQSSGSAGYAYRLEAIEICLVEKGSPAPGSTQNSFYQK